MPNSKKFETWSAVATLIFGSLLHFAFEWSGDWKPLALIAAVNESTWEHLKLAFWPAFIYASFAYMIFGRNIRNFCFAQMAKLLLMPILIIALYYGWLIFFEDSFFYDVLIFSFAIIASHYAAFRIEQSRKNIDLKEFSSIIVTLILLAFALFTYFPPKNILFEDPFNGKSGIPKEDIIFTL